MCTVLLPPGVNPIAVDIYIYIYIYIINLQAQCSIFLSDANQIWNISTNCHRSLTASSGSRADIGGWSDRWTDRQSGAKIRFSWAGKATCYKLDGPGNES
jgi:hypothetical protein